MILGRHLSSNTTPTPPHHPLLRQLFPNPWVLGWRLAHPPLSELWLFSWGSATSNLSQLKIPQRRKRERKRDLHHHPPVLGKDRIEENGTPLDVAICLQTPIKNTITGLLLLCKLQWLNPKQNFFPHANPASAACSNLLDEVTSLSV